MARKTKQDVAKAKAAKQKKIAIGGAVMLVLLLAIQVPRTMKMMNRGHSGATAAATTTTSTTTPAATPADPNSLAAPTLAGAAATTTTATAPTDLVSVVPVSADAGQLQTFERFATKDPFIVQAGESGAATAKPRSRPRTVTVPASSFGTGSGSTRTTPSGAQAPAPAPAPTAAVISLNGELMTVQVGSDFPTSGATFGRVGSIFHLVSLTAKSAKVSIVGGSYADGAPAIALAVGKPVTLQNTADGTKYTLVLQPQGTAVTPGASTSTTSTSTTTTPSTVVPSGNGG